METICQKQSHFHIFLILTTVTLTLGHVWDYTPLRIAKNADLEAYFQFLPLFSLAGVDVIKCSSPPTDQLLGLFVNTCDSFNLDTLIQKTGSYKSIWYRLSTAASSIRYSDLNRLYNNSGREDIMGLRVVNGPGGNSSVPPLRKNLRFRESLHVVYMFDETVAKKPDDPGYTAEHIDKMTPLMEAKPVGVVFFAVVFDLFYLSRTDPGLIQKSFHNTKIVLYQIDNQLKPDLLKVKQNLAKKSPKKISYFVDPELKVALASSMPYVRWDLWLLEELFPFENIKMFYEVLKDVRRLLDVRVKLCGEEMLALNTDCKSDPIVHLDYAIQMLDRDTIFLFDFENPRSLKDISFWMAATPPFIAVHVLHGPNALNSSQLVALDDLNLNGNIRFVFGFVEQ